MEAFERWTSVWAVEARRVLKPGGYLLAFGAPRTFHRLVAGMEDAGLEVRDQLLWLNGQGLPKSPRLPGGRGTTLKPAYEPILLARAPFSGTTRRNLEEWGMGALNIDATRTSSETPPGRWPANVVLSHTESCSSAVCAPDCPVSLLDHERLGSLPSRLFYCAKTSRAEREAGCEAAPKKSVQLYTGKSHPPRLIHNVHPTVKPLELMRWLVRLITPPGGLVLDPFTGSGSTGAAAVLEGTAVSRHRARGQVRGHRLRPPHPLGAPPRGAGVRADGPTAGGRTHGSFCLPPRPSNQRRYLYMATKTKAQVVYETVEEMVASGVEKSEAFRQMADAAGRPYDSIRGSYYTHKKKIEGGETRPRTKRRTTTPDDALADARAAFERAIESIDREVESAKARAKEAAGEYEEIGGAS